MIKSFTESAEKDRQLIEKIAPITADLNEDFASKHELVMLVIPENYPDMDYYGRDWVYDETVMFFLDYQEAYDFVEAAGLKKYDLRQLKPGKTYNLPNEFNW